MSVFATPSVLSRPQYDPSSILKSRLNNSHVVETFDGQADLYDQAIMPTRRPIYAPLIKMSKLRGDEDVLDIGSGNGEEAIKIAKKVPDGRVLAIDASKRMTEISLSKSNGLKNLSIENLNFENGEFDHYLKTNGRNFGTFDRIYDVFVTPWTDNDVKHLKKVKSLLKQGGIFISVVHGDLSYQQEEIAIADTMFEFRHYGVHTLKERMELARKICHYRRYDDEDLIELMKKVGVEHYELKSFSPETLTDPILYHKRMIALRGNFLYAPFYDSRFGLTKEKIEVLKREFDSRVIVNLTKLNLDGKYFAEYPKVIIGHNL